MSGATENLPKMVYDYRDERLRNIADNIWHAQMAGWPQILTYIYRPKAEKAKVRRLSLSLAPRIESRDEYPFASTLENEGSVWIGHAPSGQQNAQGTLIHRFLSAHRAYKSGREFRFIVEVINHPLGPVTAPLR